MVLLTSSLFPPHLGKLFHNACSHKIDSFLRWWISKMLPNCFCQKQRKDEHPHAYSLTVMGKNLPETYSQDRNDWVLSNFNTSIAFSSISVYTPIRVLPAHVLANIWDIYFFKENEYLWIFQWEFFWYGTFSNHFSDFPSFRIFPYTYQPFCESLIDILWSISY